MKKFFIINLVLFMLLSLQMSVFATFEDIENHWAEEIIVEFTEKGYLVSGDVKFNPDSEITKGEVATLINRYFSYGSLIGEDENLQLAIKNGYLENSQVSEKITREEIAVLICKVLSLKPIEEKTSFVDDYFVSAWSKGCVVALEKERIMIGYMDNTYKPKKYITKAEFVTVLNRCIGVGGTDLEILDVENGKLEVGVFEFIDGEMEFISIEGKVEIRLGESLILALKVPTGVEEENLDFYIKNPSVIKWDKDLFEMTGIKKGKTKMEIKTKEEVVSFEIVVE